MLQSAEYRSPWMVLRDVSLALNVVSALWVCVGQMCGPFLPRETTRYAAGGLFVVMGVPMLLKVI